MAEDSNSLVRSDGRRWDESRPTIITPGYQRFAEGSALIEAGLTKVLCAASLEERVPPFLRGQNKGWVTAEYSMLPRSTTTRTSRDRDSGRVSGRSQEIQRLIGRALRAVTDLPALGERTVHIDCDVVQADGGTRTAAITGAYVALYQALRVLVKQRLLPRVPLRDAVAAISVGLVEGELMLDLCYNVTTRTSAPRWTSMWCSPTGASWWRSRGRRRSFLSPAKEWLKCWPWPRGGWSRYSTPSRRPCAVCETVSLVCRGAVDSPPPLARIPHLAQTSDAVNRQLSCFSSRYMNLLAVFQI